MSAWTPPAAVVGRQHVQERAPLFRDPHHIGHDVLEGGGRRLGSENLLDRRHDRQPLLASSSIASTTCSSAARSRSSAAWYDLRRAKIFLTAAASTDLSVSVPLVRELKHYLFEVVAGCHEPSPSRNAATLPSTSPAHSAGAALAANLARPSGVDLEQFVLTIGELVHKARRRFWQAQRR